MRLFLGAICLIVWNTALGQYKGPNFPIQDEWFKKHGRKGLQEGNVLPDIPLGKVLNNKTGKNRFSEFKGKLLILDFWNTRCSSCIAGFPKMEQLQQKFGNKIQIFLVNPRETEEEIKKRMKRFHLPDLPIIVSPRKYSNEEEFYKNPPLIARYFPMEGVPHHVWIDGNGIVRLRGGSENTYAEKITELLAGKSIQFLKNSSTIPDLVNDRNAHYYQQLSYLKNTPISYGSFITPYTNEVTGSYGAIRKTVDSLHGIRIHTYINQDLYRLYLECSYGANSSADSSRAKLLYSPHPYTPLDFTDFPESVDTLLYTSDPSVFHRNLTTEQLIRSRFCYEQVVPVDVPDIDRYQMMLEDLNRYFKMHYRVTGHIEERIVPCYELVRRSHHDQLGIDTVNKYESEIITEQGDSLIWFQGYLDGLFRNIFHDYPETVNTLNKPLIILNETEWPNSKLISLKIPVDQLRAVADLKKILQKYGVDLVKTERKFLFLMFTKANPRP